jgi:para-nitrobenzyl esterase
MKKHGRRRSTAARTALAGLAALWGVCAVVAPAAAGLVVNTDKGPVRGIAVNGIHEFLGIPYAAPPVGDLRWRPPEPHARWTTPRDASQFANHCPQGPSPFGLASDTEDCLFLNVFTASDGDRDRDDRHRPVMVWIHGGALVVGESNDFDPTNLVNDGVVVVTINYRLGALGFLAHPALAAESTDPDDDRDTDANSAGDYGLMHQQMALRWVQNNIAAFGGDPDDVTIFGESAGGLSVFSQLASPAARGLFRKAIVESGAYALNTQSLATAEAAGTAFANAAGCSSQTAACLRALSVATILAHENPGGYTPNVDGEFLPMPLAVAFATGQFNHVPVIQGTNHDEWRLFTALDFDLLGHPIGNDEADYEKALATLVGPAAAPLVAAQYPLASFASADLAFAAAGTDLIFACPALSADLSLTKFVPLFAYEFNDENAPQDFLPPATFPYGAAHASELQYLFTLPTVSSIGLPRTPLNADQEDLSEAMVRYWTNFAKRGTPNSSGVPFWQQFDAALDDMQSLVPPTPTGETNFAIAHHCAFWAPFLAAEGVTTK